MKKNGKFWRSILILLIAGALWTKCNITYKVRNQYNQIAHLYHFPCGKLSVELVGKGNSKFIVKQKFDLYADIVVRPDCLRIVYNDIAVDGEFKEKMARTGKREINISDKKTLEIAFDLDRGVFEGDTILVCGQKYMKCQDEFLSLDTVFYSFRNNIRIRGINDF
ncbi:MAG: hypothetical protein MI975_12425 [Cytophagales bacterium]|nr:hypothetical protein [Cytophagales bacterium]